MNQMKRYFFKSCLLLMFLLPNLSNSQVEVRLVEAEFSATANVTAYIMSLVSEEVLKAPLKKLVVQSLVEGGRYFEVCSIAFNLFSVYLSITETQTLLAIVSGLMTTVPPFFNGRKEKYLLLIAQYQSVLLNLDTRIASSSIANRGNAFKLTFAILTELERMNYQIGKMIDYLYTRHLLALIPLF